jgi:hypothetical protein
MGARHGRMAGWPDGRAQGMSIAADAGSTMPTPGEGERTGADAFVSAALAVRDKLLSVPLAHPEIADYMRSDERLAEARVVAPCALRLVTAELRPPTETKPVGRFGPTPLFPPIGKYLGRRIESRDVHAAVRRLVLQSLAQGYFTMINAEGGAAVMKDIRINVVPDRVAEDVWPYWVTNMGPGGMLRRVAGEKLILGVETACGEDLFRGLRALGLVGWRRGRTRSIAAFYGEAGMLLRVLQTDNFQPSPQDELLTATNVWPFEEMAVA